jgi:hypothetical protein
MKSIYIFRNFIQRNGAKHWQYLTLGFTLSFLSAILWFYVMVRVGIEFGIITILIGGIQGILAYLFMKQKGEAPKVFFAFLFSFFAYFLGKYLYFEHYFDWYLSAYIDKSVLNTELLRFYLANINYESINLFISEFNNIFSPVDILWVILIIFSNLQFLFYNFEKHSINTPNAHRKTFQKRRFE